jgi:hypothetical protein
MMVAERGNKGAPMRRIVLLSSCLAAALAGAPICPQVQPKTAPAWADISPLTSFLFSDLQRIPRKPGQKLPFTVRTPPGPVGAYDSHTFPAGPPFYSNATGASIDCLPSLDPSLSAPAGGRPPRMEPGCPAGQVGEGCAADGDCTGHRILRTPSAGIETGLVKGTTGISYLGTFDGESGAAPGGLVQVVFFHQSADYLAQLEYGFLRDMAVPNQLTFYWQSYANCTLQPAAGPNTMCTTLQGDRQPATYIYTDNEPPPFDSPITGACNIDLGPTGGFGRYYYSMWIFPQGGTFQFGMSILDPNTLAPVVPETSIDPNVGAPSPWFSISTLNGADGYVTAGIARYDPFRTQTFSLTEPTMTIERLAAGAAPQ